MLPTIPHFDQWLGIWAIREDDFQAGYQWFMGLDLHVHLQSAAQEIRQAAASAPALDIRDGVAVIGLYGSLMKQRASMSRSTSTVETRRAIRAAARNPDVSGILLHVESPGGTAAGTKELADDIAAAAKQKPVYGYAEDLACSAAYWCLAQCTKTFANATAIVGSIGTYGVVYDYSAAVAKEGIRVHVIRAGEMKGAFTPGTEITAEQLAEQQKIVNDLNEFFIRGVKAGRSLSLEQTRELADGRVYVGQAAADRKLIDGVQSLDDTFSQLAAHGRRSRSNNMHLETTAGDTTVATQSSALTPEASQVVQAAATAATATAASQPASQAAASAAPRPATLAELKAACAGAPSDFIVAQLEAQATLDQARNAWIANLAAANQKLSQENASLKTAGPASASAAGGNTGPGASPIPAGSAAATSSAGGDAISQWDEQLQQLMTDRKLTKAQAIAHLAHNEPQLHQAYLAAWNAQHAKARK